MQNEIALENKHFKDINPMICGEEVCKPQHSYGPNMRPYYLLHYVTFGEGDFYVDNIKYHIRVGEAFLIKPGQITTYTADNENPWTYIWIGFDGELAKMFDDMEPHIKNINGSVFQEFLECRGLTSTRELFLVSKIFKMFAEFFEENKNTNYIGVAKNYISANYMNKITISDVAVAIGLNSRYLSRIFKSSEGHTMQEYLIKKRMQTALNLLKDGYLSAEVSEMVGYSEPAIFSRAFKTFYGKSPTFYL
ncbi:MAG: AraC family transcriptional regulator [Oscillospiraceae bacterium]